MRVKLKFDGGVWYEGQVTNIAKSRGGDIVKIGVKYDDR